MVVQCQWTLVAFFGRFCVRAWLYPTELVVLNGPLEVKLTTKIRKQKASRMISSHLQKGADGSKESSEVGAGPDSEPEEDVVDEGEEQPQLSREKSRPQTISSAFFCCCLDV